MTKIFGSYIMYIRERIIINPPIQANQGTPRLSLPVSSNEGEPAITKTIPPEIKINNKTIYKH